MQVTLKVCDVCHDKTKDESELRQYEIKSDDGRKVKLDLCEADRQRIEAFLPQQGARPAAADSARPAVKGTGARRPRSRVTTIEDIEKLKQ